MHPAVQVCWLSREQVTSGEQVGNMADMLESQGEVGIFRYLCHLLNIFLCLCYLSQNNHKNNLQVTYCGGIGTTWPWVLAVYNAEATVKTV